MIICCFTWYTWCSYSCIVASYSVSMQSTTSRRCWCRFDCIMSTTWTTSFSLLWWSWQSSLNSFSSLWSRSSTFAFLENDCWHSWLVSIHLQSWCFVITFINAFCSLSLHFWTILSFSFLLDCSSLSWLIQISKIDVTSCWILETSVACWQSRHFVSWFLEHISFRLHASYVSSANSSSRSFHSSVNHHLHRSHSFEMFVLAYIFDWFQSSIRDTTESSSQISIQSSSCASLSCAFSSTFTSFHRDRSITCMSISCSSFILSSSNAAEMTTSITNNTSSILSSFKTNIDESSWHSHWWHNSCDISSWTSLTHFSQTHFDVLLEWCYCDEHSISSTLMLTAHWWCELTSTTSFDTSSSDAYILSGPCLDDTTNGGQGW